MTYIPTVLSIFFATGVSLLFYWCNKKSRFSAIPEIGKQVIYGLVFGLLAILNNHLGLIIDGALVSTRDSAPLCAGLIFGPVAGLIAGVVGGGGRMLGMILGDGTITGISSGFATILAGLVPAALRKWLFDDKRPAWYYGLGTTFVIEVTNMLLVFASVENVHQAYSIIEQCVFLLITMNIASVSLAMFSVSLIAGDFKQERKSTRLQLAQIFSRYLLLSVLLAFVISGFFIYALQSRLAVDDADSLLSIYIEDVKEDINGASDANLLRLARTIREEIERAGGYDKASLIAMRDAYDVSEINIIDESGVIVQSTTTAYVGFDMRAGSQSAAFMALLRGTDELVQRYQQVSHQSGVLMKYAGVVLSDGGFVQVGYDPHRFQRDIDEQVVGITRNRHVGEDGFMLVANEDMLLVSDPAGHEGESLSVTGLDLSAFTEGELFLESVYGQDYYVMYGVTEGYYIIGAMPFSEVVFNRNINLRVLVFIEILVFAALFILIYFLVKKLVVENIQKINRSLEEITGGNLDVSVDVRTNEEFISLSDDINSTVDTLKGYIAEAATRIDKELSFAKTIQFSTLPSVFPPYPHRTDFDIYASMATAKEVGGDFYDFYLLDESRLCFLMADVSGKGISAAMFMMKAKTLIKSHAEKESDVAKILTRANEDLCENNEAEMFVTCWMGILDFNTHTVHFVNAGHNPPLVRRKNGSYEFFRTRPGFVLAGIDGFKYRSGELELLPGDEIFLYTDGVTEATDSSSQLYGDDRLKSILNKLQGASAKEICQKVKVDVDAFVGSAPQFDDMTMLCLRLRPKNIIAVNPKEESISDVVAFVERTLIEANVPDTVAMLVNIATEELYSNIRKYSGADKAFVECTVADELITLVLTDNGFPYNPLDGRDIELKNPVEDGEVGGLGLFMVKKTMDDVKYAYSDGFNRMTLRKGFQKEETK